MTTLIPSDKLARAAAMRVREGATWRAVTKMLGISAGRLRKMRKTQDWQDAITHTVEKTPGLPEQFNAEARALALAAEGRPSDCTPEVAALVADAMHDGLYFKEALALVGVSTGRGYQWLDSGIAILEEVDDNLAEVSDRDMPFALFADRVRRAEAAALLFSVKLVRLAAEDKGAGDWRAAAWWLEHRKPTIWGTRRHEVNVGGQADNPVVVVPMFGVEDPLATEEIAEDGSGSDVGEDSSGAAG